MLLNLKSLRLLTALLFISISINAQHLTWVRSEGGIDNDFASSVKVDTAGFVYVCGTFSDTVDFDPGNPSATLVSSGYTDIFIQKLDSNGNLIWVKSIGGPDHETTTDLVLGPEGHIYITGFFENTIDFDPGSSTFNLTSNGIYDSFVLKLDNQGNFVWANAIGGVFSDYAFGITVDEQANIYTTGRFRDTVDFDPGSGVTMLYSPDITSAYVLKMDENGNFIWAKSVRGIQNLNANANSNGSSIDIDVYGNVIICGEFQYTVDFDPSASTHLATSTGAYDIFVLKLDNLGNFLWAKTFGGFVFEYSYDIISDKSGNVYVTGEFSASVDFDPDSNSTFNITSNGSTDIFLEKLNPNGDFVWAKNIGGTLYEKGYSLAIDDSTNIYIVGDYSGTVDFDPNSGTVNFTSNGGTDFFIEKLDSNGNFIWVNSFGGSYNDRVRSVCLDNNGGIYISGTYEDTVDFDPGLDTYNLISNGIGDAYILKLSKYKKQDTTSGNPPKSIREFSLENSIKIYPNPSRTVLNISFDKAMNCFLTIHNEQGAKVLEQSINSQLNTIKTENFVNGVYFIQLRSGNEQWTGRFVKLE